MEEPHKPDQTGGATLPFRHRLSLSLSQFHHHSHLTVYCTQTSIPFLFFHPLPYSSTILSDCANSGSMSTLSKDDNLVLSSEDSSCPEESELELGLGLSLSRSSSKSHNHVHGPYARIYTAKDFSSSTASPSSSSSSSPSSLSRPNITAGTKRAADSLVANNRPSQVVGWPPLRTYRVNSFNSHAKSTEVFNSMPGESKSNNTVVRKTADNGIDNNNINIKEKGHLRSSPFVKVNMDGIPIGRKVDLSAHSSYETLAQALEDLFNESTTVITCKGSHGEDHGIIIGGERHSKLLDGSTKFVLTYEDKEGDWMLVGDVPWVMFLSSVRRLRIMRTSEANGLAPGLEEKNIRQKGQPI
ncbi:auxin-responsive protein IAA11-like [Abrus precatorius]|uniref:Auxin-induced protein n=1 Tax=Abrus precatorius TaxID=3816 RepID=A0A8B8M7C7_ABRPR|nr:auxin-responsive protein IAA11-like [Abrus precatorius]